MFLFFLNNACFDILNYVNMLNCLYKWIYLYEEVYKILHLQPVKQTNPFLFKWGNKIHVKTSDTNTHNPYCNWEKNLQKSEKNACTWKP
jgi:hypothetical protein